MEEAIAEVNDRIAKREEGAPWTAPVRHVHTQIYHRSRVTLRRVRNVQDLCMGYYVPRIALRDHPMKRAQKASERISRHAALGPDGYAAERRFEQKLADAPLGMRYESVVMINMEGIQEHYKQSK